jgi:hypothetical protein
MIPWRQFSLRDGGAPKSAEAGSFGARFRFWIGASGRRYLFTAVSAEELPDFADAIVVVARGDASRGYAGVDIADLGAAGEASAARIARRIAADSGLAAFVHLLAVDAERRGAIAADLIGATALAA